MWDTFMTLTEIYWKLSNNVMTNNFEDERRNVEADAVTTVRRLYSLRHGATLQPICKTH